MRNFSEHRRKLTKQHKIRGTETTVTGNTNELTLAKTAGVGIKGLTIQGGTVQPSPYTGTYTKVINLTEFTYETASSPSWYPIHYRYPTLIELPVEEVFIELRQKAELPETMPETVSIGAMNDIGDYFTTLYASSISMGSVNINYPFYLIIADELQSSDFDIGKYWGYLTTYFELVMTYEVTATTPTPSTPIPIQNAGDNGIEVRVRSTNMFDLSKISGVSNNGDGTFTVTAYPTMFGQIKTLCPDLRVGDTVYFYFDTTSDVKYLYIHENKKYYNSGDSFTIETEAMLNYRLFLYRKKDGSPATISNFRVVYEKDTPYAPYFEPQTVTIPSEVTLTDGTTVKLPFRYAGKYSATEFWQDKLVIDGANKTVKYYSNTMEYAYTGNETFLIGSSQSGGTHNRFYSWNVSMYISITTGKGRGYCTHLPLGSYSVGKNGCLYGVSNELVYFILNSVDFPDTTSVKAWLKDENDKGTPVTVVAPYKETVYDLTETELGQELLAIKLPYDMDAVIELSSSPEVGGLSATYYSMENEDKLNLTIHYANEATSTTLKNSEIHSVRKGSRYKLIAPEIEGYEPLQAEYEDYLTEDREITITYKEI